MDRTSNPGRDWHIYTEIQTGVLISGDQLDSLTASLTAAAGVKEAEAMAGSLGSRYSVAARIRLAAPSAAAAKDTASHLLSTLLVAINAQPAKVIASGSIDG